MTNAVQNQRLSSLRENDVVGVIGMVHAIEDDQVLIRFTDPLHGDDTFVPFSHSTLRLVRRTIRVDDIVIHPDGREVVVKAIIDDATVSFCEPGADTAVIENFGHVSLGLLTYKDQVSQKAFGSKLPSLPVAEPEADKAEADADGAATDETLTDQSLDEDKSKDEATNDVSAEETASTQVDDATAVAGAPEPELSKPEVVTGEVVAETQTSPAEANGADDATAKANDEADIAAETLPAVNDIQEPAATPELTAHQKEADEASRSIEAIRNSRQNSEGATQFPKETRDA